MREIKLIIDGKEVQLTDTQLKALEVETQKNPFNRVNNHNKYYYIMATGGVSSYKDVDDSFDRKAYNAINYFNDKQFANQVALHQLLYRRLLKFAYDNDCVATAKWSSDSIHWFIYYDHNMNYFETAMATTVHQPFTVYFSTIYAACSAIKEVIEPFMKEHPEFMW